MKHLCSTVLGLLLCGAVNAAPMQALNDEELSEVTGGAIGLAAHVDLNIDRIAWGFNGADDVKTYLVIDKLDGIIDVFALAIDLKRRADGGSDYVAISLPDYIRFTKFGIGSIGAQSDALAPVTGSLGRFEIDGQLSFTGQVIIWPH